ncbi:MAG: Zn-ribbon domain-containing OB-fold protein [Sulfolobus sp.]|nr:Zn-ribbon domain-containing OB-fold protein [Sulfolobus sp.]
MAWEKKGTEGSLLSWYDNMEVESYVYTAGPVGEAFIKGLNEKKILGSKCPKCGRIYVPARLYCEYCFVKTEDTLVEVKGKAYIDSYTIVYQDHYGNPLQTPLTIGIIRFEGATGGLLAYIEGTPEIGKEVEIVSYGIPLKVRVK